MSANVIRLTTDRLLLREFWPNDWQAVLAYQSKPEYLRYYAWEQRSENDVRKFVQQFINWQEERPRSKFQFALVLPGEQELIGVCGLRMSSVDAYEGELGYEIDPGYWGRGFATEAVQALLAFGFKEKKLHRIGAWSLSENRASVRVLEKTGLQLEGRLRENKFFKGRWWDSLIYGILEREWAESST
jgi:RimJ/RimL family protein N-acetyltransferase